MSNAEARSWWADVQHLRPDAPTASAVLARPEPADERAVDPLLEPAPGRRFVRSRPEGRGRTASPEPTGPRAQRPAPEERPAARRIVLLRDDELEEDSGEIGSRDPRGRDEGPHDARAARPSTVDLDFDFGRAAEDRARRRTAQRLGGSVPAGRAATSGRSAAPVRRDGTTTDASDPTERPLAGSLPAADSVTSAGRTRDGAALALVPLAPPPARHGVLGRPARGTTAPRRRPRGRHLASQPDRIALWAVVLGILLIALAAASSRADAATLAAPQSPAALERTVAPAAGAPASPADASAGLAG